MTCHHQYAFTSEQATFINEFAPALPKRWAYNIEILITQASTVIDIEKIYEVLLASKSKVLRGLINFPEIHSLGQYIDHSGSALVITSQHDGEGMVVRHLDFVGSSPRDWVLSAVKNAETILELIERLVVICQSETDAIRSDDVERRHKLVPPLDVQNPIADIIRPHVDMYFRNMSAEQVVAVFQERKGTLTMHAESILTIACILEAIREGLDLSTKDISSVKVSDLLNREVPWTSTNGTNKLAANIRTARQESERNAAQLAMHNSVKERLFNYRNGK
ncbi:MAG: hypothetical protein IPI29_04010 [Ignavibacteria bacterium]|nr:hypothetical protein [Ignavibacteria bacterium]